MKVKIGPWVYEYDFSYGRMKKGVLGQVDSENLTIHIKASLPPEQKAETAFHETFHAIADVTGCVPEDENEEERIVRGFSSGMWVVLKTNKEFRDYIFSELNKED
jgi:hypothetical protein